MKRVVLSFLCLLVTLSVFASGQKEEGKKEKRELLFTTMSYGDVNSWTGMWKEMTDQFYEETGIEVTHEIVNWGQAREKITTWHLGGDAPDVVDMFWSKTFSQLGADEFGTRPIENDIEKYIPDFYERFPASALGDVQHRGHLYGVPWRVDVRPMVYRKDMLAEAGIDPDSIVTWEDLIEAGNKLTVKDASGNITRYGLGFVASPAQELYSWLWQAGGAFMNDSYDKATIDTPSGREAVGMMRRLVVEEKIVSSDFILDPSYDAVAEFAAGKIAIIPFSSSLKTFIENNAPQLKDVVVARAPVQYKTQDSFQGAGYFSATYQCKDVDAALQWMAFISRTENMIKLGQLSGNLSPCIPALEDDFFKNNWWFSGQIKALPYGRSSQHPNAAWGAISNEKPGSPLYDMLTDVINGDVSVNEALSKCEKQMQDLIDEVN